MPNSIFFSFIDNKQTTLEHETETNTRTDINAVEVAKLDDIDPEQARKGLAEYRSAMDAAQPDSLERAQAQIAYEVHEAMCTALGIAA